MILNFLKPSKKMINGTEGSDAESTEAKIEEFMDTLSALKDGFLDENEKLKPEVLSALGLSDEEEKVNLPAFRGIIADNLDIDGSFMFKRIFIAADKEQKGFLTPKQIMMTISTLMNGPFEDQIEMALQIYGKPTSDRNNPATVLNPSAFAISKTDAVESIVESLQLSSPRARHTLTTTTRERAYKVAEDLVSLIFPKLDIDKDGIISYEDMFTACKNDPSLIQVFGQFLPKNAKVEVCPSVSRAVTPQGSADSQPLQVRPASSVNSFEKVEYLTHSPTIGTMWGRVKKTETNSSLLKKSDKLEPIPLVNKEQPNPKPKQTQQQKTKRNICKKK